MTKLKILSVLLLHIATASSTDALASAKANKAVVADFFSKFSSGGAKEALALVAPNVKWWVPESLPFGGTYDRAGYTTKVLSKFAGFRGSMKLVVKSMVAIGNVVAAEVESHGVHTCGEPEPFIYNNKYHFKIVLKDGLFVEVNEYMDTHHLASLYSVMQTESCQTKLRTP